MSKNISFSYKDKDYVLEFTRRTVAELERLGFSVSDIETKPMTTIPTLFHGAFLAHHRFVKQELIDEIYNTMTDKQALLGKLAEMYNEPIETLVEEPEEGKEGNVTWVASW